MAPGRRIVIVGGGVSGLASAALLAADGHQVTLLEAREEFGGRAGSWERDGFRFDTGPSWYLMPDVFEHFYELLGTSAAEQLDLGTLDPGYRAYFEGQPEPFDLPAGSERARDALTALDPGAAARINGYLDSAAETYSIAVRQFLYGSFESARPFLTGSMLKRAPRLVRLLLRSLDAEIRSHTREPRLRRLLGYPAVFLGGSPMKTPAMYHLMSHLDVNDGVLYPQGGFARVIETLVDLARAQGAELRAGADVQRVVVEGGAARGVEYRDATGELHSINADVVIVTADRHHAERQLLGEPHREHSERWWRRRDPGPGAVLAMLGVRGTLPELAHHTLLLADDWEHAFAAIAGKDLPQNPSIYIGKPSASDTSVAPEGHENLFVLIPVPAEPGFGRGGADGTGDAAIEGFVDQVIEQIGQWIGVDDLAERVVVRRTVAPGDFEADLRAWRGSALGPAHTLSQSAMFRPGNKSRRVDGLYFAGSSTIPGIGVPMCLISAELLVKRLRGDTSAAPLESL